jgi:ABC-2 type transport system permease protein
MKPYYKYAKSFALGAQSAMEYRADFLLGMLSAAWPIFIQFFLWKSIYAGSGQASLFGYTYPQMITYTIIANIVQRLTRTGFEYDMNDDIKNGGLDKFIIRPVGYFQYRMATFIGGKLFQFAVIFIVMIGAIVAIDCVYGNIIMPLNVLYFVVTLALAFVLNFIIFFCVGMLAFQLTEIGFLYEAVRIVFIAFSGGIFPLDVFGPKVVAVLSFLPFKYTVNFPVDVLTGRVAGLGVPVGMLIQLVWIAGLSLLTMRLWAIGQKKYVAAGG